MAAGAALHHSLIGFLNIDTRNLGEDGIGEHGDGVVANHTVVVLSPEVPNGQIAVGLMVQHHVMDKLCSDIGRNKCVKWMSCTEGVPKAEGTMICLSLWHLFDFKVGSHIATIHIAHRIGLHQHVIKSCVEDGLLLIGTFNVNAAQLVLPSIMGGLDIFIKVPTLGFRQHVFPCAFVIDGRDGHFYHQFLAIGRVETQSRT